MALYFKDIEITNIDNLVPQSGLDITDIWFGSTNIYTVWQTYEGTLPATINANGADMRQYRVYGATGGVGDRTANLFDYRDYVDGYYISSSGIEIEASRDPSNRSVWLSHSDYISISPDESYTMSAHHQNMSTYQAVAIAWYDENKNFISRDSTTIPRKDEGTYSFTATAPQNAKFAIFNFFTDDVQGIMFVKGTTLPEIYVPFGYEVDMSVKSGNIFDKSSAVVYNAYISTGDIWTNSANAKSIKIKVKPSTTYTISTFKVLSIFRVAESDDENVEPSSSSIVTNVIRLTNATHSSFTTTANAKTLIFQGDNNDYQDWIDGLMIKEGNEMPTKYQPYSNTTTPIYIGDDPLDKDEYVDYQEQKVYRMIDGTLTPTDPPVALPALPTCDGETVVDYAGRSQAVPEKVLLKYRKEGF